MISDKLLQDIKLYSIKNKSIECCGLIVGSKKSQKFVKCNNIHSKPQYAFSIDPKELLIDDVKYIFHSHPIISSRPSDIDKKYCNELRIPFLIYSILNDDFFIYHPE
tara:strand:+ start:2685 stop:3005 length:321 start_codon:yes stop_codon:yes gene_type:complete